MSFLDKSPPADTDVEAAVLSACMHFPAALAKCVEQISAEDFTTPFHKGLYAAISNLFRRNEPVDLITLKQELPSDLFPQLVDAYGLMPMQGHTSHHVKTLRDLTTRRRAIGALVEATEELFSQGSEATLSALMGRLMRLQVRDPAVGVEKLSDVMARQRDQILALADRREAGDHTDERPAVFGLEGLDNLITLTRDTYLLLGARPSAGKTSLALQMALHNAQNGRRVLFFSLEMSKDDIAKKVNTQLNGISHHKQNRGYLNAAERAGIQQEAERAAQYYPTLLINDKAGLTVSQMQAALLRSQYREGPVDLIIIDHLIKVRSTLRGESSKHAQLSQISNDLREMVRNNRIPIVCLTQLRRPQQGQEDRAPELTDLRESGSLEEDADVIALLHRPAREGYLTPASVYVGKNRNGPVGRCEMLFQGMYVRFMDETGGQNV